jgi:hypothetical protein
MAGAIVHQNEVIAQTLIFDKLQRHNKLGCVN